MDSGYGAEVGLEGGTGSLSSAVHTPQKGTPPTSICRAGVFGVQVLCVEVSYCIVKGYVFIYIVLARDTGKYCRSEII